MQAPYVHGQEIARGDGCRFWQAFLPQAISFAIR
jgi:hypothetical protein